MSDEIIIDLMGFTGLNLKETEDTIADTELSECVNFDIGRAGELIKRPGFATVHDGSVPGNYTMMMVGHYITDSISRLIAKSAQEHLYKSDDGTTWTLLAASHTVEYGVQYGGYFYMVTETNFGLEKYDGAAITSTVGVGPPGSFCIVYKDRLFVLNVNAAGNIASRLYFSGIADFTSWPGTNFLDVNPGDGDRLIACAVYHDVLYIFKTKSTWALYAQGAPENWVLRNINPELGCISKWTPIEIEGFLYFVGANGVYKTDGLTFQNISETIDSVFKDRVVDLPSVDIDSTVWWEDRLITLVNLSSGKRYFVYNLRSGAWTEWVPQGIKPGNFLPVLTGTPARGVYCGNLDPTGKIFKFGTEIYQDNSQTYSCYFKTKKFDFGKPVNYKRGKWGTATFYGNSTLSVVHHTDNTVSAARNMTGTASLKMHKFKGPGYFRALAMKFTFNANVKFEFHAASLLMHLKRTLIKSL